MSLASGTRLGSYETLAAIGAGGMGEVYKARDTRLERTVAVKVLPSHLAASPKSRQRFEREGKTISQPFRFFPGETSLRINVRQLGRRICRTSRSWPKSRAPATSRIEIPAPLLRCRLLIL